MVSILQSQLHNVNGRRASGDLTILPLLSTSEDVRINTVLLSASNVGVVPPPSTCLYELKRTCAPNPSPHLLKLHGIPSRPGADSFFCGHEFVKLAIVDYPADVVRSFLNVSQDVLRVVVPLTINARLKDCTPNIHITSCLIHLRFPGMDVFIGNSMKEEHWFLGAPRAKSNSAFRQGTVFFRLCLEEVSYFSFSFCEVFTRQARNDLAEPVEINAFERNRIKAFSHEFPRFTTSHWCSEVSVSTSS